jgi:hypothetical protein
MSKGRRHKEEHGPMMPDEAPELERAPRAAPEPKTITKQRHNELPAAARDPKEHPAPATPSEKWPLRERRPM